MYKVIDKVLGTEPSPKEGSLTEARVAEAENKKHPRKYQGTAAERLPKWRGHLMARPLRERKLRQSEIGELSGVTPNT